MQFFDTRAAATSGWGPLVRTRRQRLSRLLLFAAVCCLGAASPASAANIQVVFRYDDFSQLSDTATDTRIIEVFTRQGVPVVFGVIPLHKGEQLAGEKAALLRRAVDAGVVECALHGHRHEYRQEEPPSPMLTEFRGLDQAEQLVKITDGKHILESVIGRPVEAFVPPVNTYDLNTVRAVEQAGLSILSADFRGPVDPASTLSFVPFTCLFHEIPLALERIRQSRGSGTAALVVLTHPYEFTGGTPEPNTLYGSPRTINIDAFAALIAQLKSEADIEITGLRALAREEGFSAPAYRAAAESYDRYMTSRAAGFNRAQRLSPPFLLEPLRDPLGYGLFYPPSPGRSRYSPLDFASLYGRPLLLYCAVCLGSFAVSMFLLTLLRVPAFPKFLVRSGQLTLSLASLALFAYVTCSLSCGYKLTGLLTGCLGIGWAIVVRRRPAPAGGRREDAPCG